MFICDTHIPSRGRVIQQRSPGPCRPLGAGVVFAGYYEPFGRVEYLQATVEARFGVRAYWAGIEYGTPQECCIEDPVANQP